MYSIGIVGMPNIGKTTLFNALTQAHAPASNYPFCTVEPNVGVVEIPDERVDVLGKMTGSKKIVRSHLEFIDIAGLVKGASEGEGLGNQFLAKIREVAVIVQVARCFKSENVAPYSGEISPRQDVSIVNVELIMADLATVEKRLSQEKNKSKSGDKEHIANVDTLKEIKKHLEEGKPLRLLSLEEKEIKMTDELNLLSIKPVIYVANINLEGKDNVDSTDKAESPVAAGFSLREGKKWREDLKKLANDENSNYLEIDAEVESEIADLSESEREEYYKEMGIAKTGLKRIILASKEQLELISFLTTMPKETKSWIAKKETTAIDAAAMIHSDMARGFIKAEVIGYDDLVKIGSWHEAREKGHIALHGKDYVVKEGDVIRFKFNV